MIKSSQQARGQKKPLKYPFQDLSLKRRNIIDAVSRALPNSELNSIVIGRSFENQQNHWMRTTVLYYAWETSQYRFREFSSIALIHKEDLKNPYRIIR
jgi:hypothetical protein